MNIDILTQPLQSLLAPVMSALGVNDAWFLVAALFAVICIILLIFLITTGMGRKRMRRDLIDLSDYVRGLEEMTNLQPISIPDPRDTMSVQSGRPLVAPMPAPASVSDHSEDKTERIKVASGGASADETQNLTAAIHDAIYASVTGSHSAIAPDAADHSEQTHDADGHHNDLSGRIPRI